MRKGRPRELEAPRMTSLIIDDNKLDQFLDAINTGRRPSQHLNFSDAIREYMASVIEENKKNREASLNLSAIQAVNPQTSNIITVTQVNEGLEKWLTNIDTVDDLNQLSLMEGKGLKLVQTCKARYKKVRWGV